MVMNRIISRDLLPIIVVGVAFLLIFAAFSTASQANESIFEGARYESNGEFNASGYISLSIVYTACSLCNIISPMIVSRFSSKLGLFIGALTYDIFLVSFFKPMNFSVYLAAGVLGFGASILWTAHGVYMTKCSPSAELNRNFGFFWMLFQISSLVGSTFTYFYLSHVTSITSDVRMPMIGVLTAICLSGTLILLCLPSPKTNALRMHLLRSADQSYSAPTSPEPNETPIIQAPISLRTVLVRAGYLVRTKDMIAILIASSFSGINLTFYSGVFGTCLSRMEAFGTSAKSYIGLSGIFIGIGEIVGSQMTMFASSRINSSFVMLIGYLASLLAMILTVLMIPPMAPIAPTPAIGYIPPSVYVAMFIAFMLGLIDSVGNTQISALLGKVYPCSSGDTASAFALFKFFQSISSAIAFLYSSVLLLHWQALIFLLSATLGIVSFIYADKWHRLLAYATIHVDDSAST